MYTNTHHSHVYNIDWSWLYSVYYITRFRTWTANSSFSNMTFTNTYNTKSIINGILIYTCIYNPDLLCILCTYIAVTQQCYYWQGRQTGGLGVSTPLNFGWGGWTPVNPPPPDFEKINFRGGWLPLKWSNYIVYLFLST